jgi:hypothetical protein
MLKVDSAKRCDEAVVNDIAVEHRQAPANMAIAIRRELMRKRIHIELERAFI